MRNDIGVRISDMALYQSGLMIVKVKEVHMMFNNNNNPTRAGKYISFPKWISLKEACTAIKSKRKHVLNMLFSVVIKTYLKTVIQQSFTTTKDRR